MKSIEMVVRCWFILCWCCVAVAAEIMTEPAAVVSEIFSPGAQWQHISSGHAGCEGPQWVVENNELTLIYAAHHDHLVYRWTEKSGLTVWRNDAPEATSFRPDGHGGYYVVEQTNRRLVRWNAHGEMTEILADRFEGKRLNRPNDAIVHGDGSVWFTDPEFLFKPRSQDIKELDRQCVFRWSPVTGTLSKMVDDLRAPNGIAFSPDGHWLYVGDSSSSTIYRWLIGDDGQLSERVVFATFSEKGLDGLLFDSGSRLWCATNAGIQLIDSDGKRQGVIKTPGKPTAFAFSPSSYRRVCVTTRDACYISNLR